MAFFCNPQPNLQWQRLTVKVAGTLRAAAGGMEARRASDGNTLKIAVRA